MEPFVSIIIPFYAGREWLRESLNSCINQTYKNVEIILLNDGSEENIDDIVSQYKDKVQYFYHKNMGAAATRNKGIQYAKGEYIAFLDSDDLWYPNKLKIQMDAMLEKNYMWCHCSYELFEDITKNKINVVHTGRLSGNCYPKFNYVCQVATPSVIIKRNVIIENGFSFNEKLKYGEDICFWIQLARKYPLCGIDEVLVKVRLHGKNAARNIDAQIIQRGSFLEEFIYPNKYELHFVGKKVFQYCIWVKKICKEKKMPLGIKYILFLPAWMMFKLLYKIS